jgi:membrane protein implicated in regulation of membrane protease activity
VVVRLDAQLTIGTRPAGQETEARVVRYDKKRLALGQALVPLALLATVSTRYWAHPLTWLVAGGFQLAAAVTFLRARRNFGPRTLRLAKDKVVFGNQPSERMAGVSDWTDGSVFRLYGDGESWKVEASADHQALHRIFESAFGPAPALQDRGSPRARRLSILIAPLGILIWIVGFKYDILILAPVGMACILGGWSMHGFYKSKVSGGSRSRRFPGP